MHHDNTLLQGMKGRCLILIPHSDDEWIGCSQVIKSDNDVILCNMDMKGGDNEALHQIRYEEMNRVADEHHRKFITLKGEKLQVLERVIRESGCTHIFVPHYIDWHPDHVAVMRILAAALEDINLKESSLQVVMYQVSCPIIRGINLALPLTKEECKEKWSYFKSHYPTQQHIPYLRFYYNEMINGKYVEAYAAEVYVVVEARQWLSALYSMVPDERQTEGLRNNLGSISAMRSFIAGEFAGNFF